MHEELESDPLTIERESVIWGFCIYTVLDSFYFVIKTICKLERQVERIMNMVDGVLLVVDSVDGPKPQVRRSRLPLTTAGSMA